jgi:hypothetical protein
VKHQKPTDQNALTRVEIEPAENSEFANWELIGAATAYSVGHALQWSLMVAKASEVKGSKAYKAIGTWPEFCVRRFRVEHDTMDRWIGDFRKYGRSALLLQDAMQLSRRALHALNPEDLGSGKFQIGNRVFDGITQETLPEIRDYVEDALKEKAKAQVVAADKTRDAKKYKAERDAVEREKAVVEAELDELKNPPPAPVCVQLKDVTARVLVQYGRLNLLLKDKQITDQDRDLIGAEADELYFLAGQMRARIHTEVGLGDNEANPDFEVAVLREEIERKNVKTLPRR